MSPAPTSIPHTDTPRRRPPAALRLRLGLAAGLVALLAACLPMDSSEQWMFDAVNQLRSSQGLPTLASSEPLDNRAQWWASMLAAEGGLRHSNLRELQVPFSRAGENVGRGPNIELIQGWLVGSRSHYANMVDPLFTHVGIGVARGRDGTIYAVTVFWRG